MRHEQTIVYKRSLALMETAREAIEQFPKGFSFLVDQLRRNTSSVHHNFAEGTIRILGGSSGASSATLSNPLARRRRVSTRRSLARVAQQETIARGKALALEVVRMLSKFDRPRGRQVSETVIRPQGARLQGSGVQTDRLKIASNDST